jgi:hypothetical protein
MSGGCRLRCTGDSVIEGGVEPDRRRFVVKGESRSTLLAARFREAASLVVDVGVLVGEDLAFETKNGFDDLDADRSKPFRGDDLDAFSIRKMSSLRSGYFLSKAPNIFSSRL